MDRRVQKTDAAIQKAYISLLLEKKSTKITITELARRANIDRKTFYLHYDTTDDVMKDYNKNLIQKFINLLEQQNFFHEAFNTGCLYAAMNQIISENMDFFQHIASIQHHESFWEQSKEKLVIALTDMYEDKVLMPLDVLQLYWRYVLTGVMEIYQEWLKGNIPCFTLNELGKIIDDVAFHGFAPILKQGAVSC